MLLNSKAKLEESINSFKKKEILYKSLSCKSSNTCVWMTKQIRNYLKTHDIKLKDSLNAKTWEENKFI